MKGLLLGAIVAAALIGASGCAVTQAIDQWKCDHLGWCCFGAKPSACPAPAMPACPPTVDCPPVQGCAPGGCPTGQPVIVPQTTPPVVISQ